MIPSEVTSFLSTATRDEIDHLFKLCRARTQELNAMAAMTAIAELTVGDRVKITAGISPKYLVGVTGTVTTGFAGRHDCLNVKLDYAVGKYSGTRPVGVPASCLEKVS